MSVSNEPDFYLASTNYTNFEKPRACLIKGRLSGEVRDDFMWVEAYDVDSKGKSKKNKATLILAPRFEGTTAFPINEWPLHVYICNLINKDCLNKKKCTERDLKILAWGELYQDYISAKQAVV